MKNLAYKDFYPDFPVRLGNIGFGKPFTMLNYGSWQFIRVNTHGEVSTILKYRITNPLPFNDDGFHVPIVNLANGELTWMSKEKPCRLVNEENSGSSRFLDPFSS